MKPPNLNLVKNPRALDSDLQALALVMAEGDGDGGHDDDDDFQNPSQAVALSQSLMLSSLKSSQFQPLKPSNGYRARKRPRLSAANGKENDSMLNNRASDSRVSNGGEEKIPVSTKRTDLFHKIVPVGLGNMDFGVGCVEEDGIDGLKSNISESEVSEFVDSCPCEEVGFGKGSQCLVSVESSLLKSAVNASSSVDWNCSDVCVDNDELSTNTRSSCNSEKSVSVRETESAHECKVCNEAEEGETRLASTELKLAQDWSRMKMEFRILNHFVDHGATEVNGGISSESRLFELKEKSVLSGCEDYASGIHSNEELKLNTQFSDPKVQEKGPVGGMQFVSFESCYAGSVLPDKQKGNHNCLSIEAKLLNPSGKLVPHRITSCGEEAGVCEEFEPGTQLNMLMDLCCETGEQGDSGSGMHSFEQFDLGTKLIVSERNSLVQCPLCQTDITKLSEEMRQIHTNDCLDKNDTNMVSVTPGQTKPNACNQVFDTNPVLEWLRALDLCRYEEAFIREEVDWDTLQWLTEEDLISIGVVAVGPRKKIVHALNELRQRNCLAQDGENNPSNAASDDKKNIGLPGNKLITQYFHGPVAYKARGFNPLRSFNHVENASKFSTQKRVGTRRNANRRRVREIPPWCCITGTPFRVDAFRYLRGDCSHWFLTHFHMDHYQGLTKNFCHGKVYCSKITAHLVNLKIGVPWDRIQILPINEKITIAGVNLTCLDANHCPGSIIILFEPSNNKAILHTGDFRFSSEMASSTVLQSSHIHTLILDTTYCNPQYDFPKQEEVIQFVIDAIQAEAFNPKTLFLIGTYTIGKERLFLEVARTLRRKLYVGAGKLHLLRCLGLPEEDMQLFTANEMESHIHVVPLWTIASFKRMKHISNQYSDRYNLIVAFSPTGWTSGKGKKKSPARRWQQGTIIRYEVPYSEHCSFTELKDFVRFISPENIIPSVNNEGPESVDAMLALLLSDS
ncbi:hypothetical protein KFK09_024709 [Dendrobium nobile]|uniref:SAM domain-containing protein n=1 Tax=Dendrobium nobile TaxID=94219 RepID=A0A8T3AES5_DENNO|nr:hypothetical protein KFK09_024709 [Dendrobium nobile]